MKIYIVDDDEIFQFTTRKMFQYLGQREGVESISNGQVAIDKLKDHRTDSESLPDLILLDINMPIMDGWDFLQQYDTIKKSLSKEIKIYMISSSVDDRDLERAERNENITKYISKPVDESVIREMIQQKTLI